MDGENFMENPMNKWDDLGGLPPLFLVQHPVSPKSLHLPNLDGKQHDFTTFHDIGLPVDEFHENRLKCYAKQGANWLLICKWLFCYQEL